MLLHFCTFVTLASGHGRTCIRCDHAIADAVPLPLPRTSWTQTRGGHLTCRRSRRREVHQGEQKRSVITGHTNTRDIRPPDNTWARTHGPLALAWRTPERTPTPGYRASSCHIDTEGTREMGNMDIKKTNSIEHDNQKNKRAHIGEDATTGEEAESGCRCRLPEWRQCT